MSEIINNINFRKIYKSDILVATNDRIGLSVMPILVLKKLLFKKQISCNMFVLGLFSNISNIYLIKTIQKLFLGFVLGFMTILYLLVNQSISMR